MTKEQAAALAVEYKHSGYNCAQAAARALCELFGHESDQLLKAAAGFGAGMGGMEGLCGALVGANMVAGLETDGQRTGKKSKILLEAFRQRCGHTICKTLKGVETGTVLCSCDDCVRNAVLAAAEILGAE